MCDTFVYVPTEKETGNIIFAKNSDREPNEAQNIVRIPAQQYKTKKLKCTFIEIPQVKETFEVILSKPFQMWGAEMGANEHGLVIGNEAVFTKIKITKGNSGLTGMDLLRLALERTKSADEALELITDLIAKFSQNTNGGYQNPLYYHNSFIIADKTKAWVLETAGAHWVAVKVKGYRSISNRLTIGEEFDLSSNGIQDYALKKGWLKKDKPFHFAKSFSDWYYTYFSKSARRYAKTCMLGEKRTNFSVLNAIEILSSHYVNEKDFKPDAMYNGGSVCMHATDFSNPTQTVGSMIAEIRQDKPSTYWLTGTSNTCISVYKPFFMGGNSLKNETFIPATEKFDNSFWWQAEKFHRMVMKNYHESKAVFDRERIALQLNLINAEKKLIKQEAVITELDELSYSAINQHKESIQNWQSAIKNINPALKWYQLHHKNYVNRMNRAVGLDTKNKRH